MTSDEERMAMLAGRPLDALDDDELAQVESWTRLLADDATWVEPAPDLEDLVVASIAAAPRPTTGWASTSRRTTSWVRPLLAGLAAAAAIVFAVFLLSHRGDKEATFATGELTGTELATSAHGPDRHLQGHVGLPDRAPGPPPPAAGRRALLPGLARRARRARSRSAPSARAGATG